MKRYIFALVVGSSAITLIIIGAALAFPQDNAVTICAPEGDFCAICSHNGNHAVAYSLVCGENSAISITCADDPLGHKRWRTSFIGDSTPLTKPMATVGYTFGNGETRRQMKTLGGIVAYTEDAEIAFHVMESIKVTDFVTFEIDGQISAVFYGNDGSLGLDKLLYICSQ